jgi:hypothetical protein
VWSRIAALVRDRLVFAWLAGAAVWLAWLGSLTLGGWHHDATGKRAGADHVQYYVVGQLVNEGEPGGIYDEKTMSERQKEVGGEGWEGFLPFRYPPFYALCFAPTSRLDYEVSFLVWTALGLALLVASGLFLGVELRTWLLWSLCFYPVCAAVTFGQNSLVSLAILSAAAALWLKDRPLLAGLVAGLLAFKPQLALGVGLLWIFDLRRSWTALVGIVVTTAVLTALGWLAIPEAYEAFVASFQGSGPGSSPAGTMAANFGSQGFWELLLPGLGGPARLLAVATSAAGLVVFVLLWWRVRERREQALAVAVLLTPWLTPYIMVYDWSILLIAGVLLARFSEARLNDRRVVLTAALWLTALAAVPLVLGQIRLLGGAFHPALPVLVAVVLAAWPALRSG